ncbi:MAG TPA: amidohydrolase family protein [Polyangiaceae bacterium]|nr:amidohydrolase family protein [Polyangiaceae bacterium]
MSPTYDLVIRGGVVVDGTGRERFHADVAVRDGRIAAIGDVSGRGKEELDARDKLVTPGFVDIHTHYDGQVTWDERLFPSSVHGVTTVVMGNCGVGFAPCRTADHDRLVRLMEGVEDIPFPVLTEGLPWTWESFPDYLGALERRRFDVDVGAQLPHAALRVYVMGERGVQREAATPDDIAAMSALAEEAALAGALGFSTSRTLNHRTSDGQPTPTLLAGEDELIGIARGFARANNGVLQFVSDFIDPDAEFDMLRRIVERSGRPLSFSLAQNARAPAAWRRLLNRLSEATSQGLPMRAQVCGRAVGILLGLELTLNPFSQHPSYRSIAHLDFRGRLQRLRDRAFCARLLEEAPAERGPLTRLVKSFANVFVVREKPDYEPSAEDSLAEIAARTGATPLEVALAHMLTRDGRGMLYVPFLNYADGSLDCCYEMLTHPDAVIGLSDGGAHVGMICDGSLPTSNLTHWTRDRTRGERLSLERVVRMQTRDTARAIGLHDRGELGVGLRADVNVIDYDRLALHAPEVVYDLPAGGRRLLQRADGYVATIAAGEVTYREGQPTGALPGRLVRSRTPRIPE